MNTKTTRPAPRTFARPSAAEMREFSAIKKGIIAAGYTEICSVMSDVPNDPNSGIHFVKYHGGEANWRRGDPTTEFIWNKGTEAEARKIAGYVGSAL